MGKCLCQIKTLNMLKEEMDFMNGFWIWKVDSRRYERWILAFLVRASPPDDGGECHRRTYADTWIDKQIEIQTDKQYHLPKRTIQKMYNTSYWKTGSSPWRSQGRVSYSRQYLSPACWTWFKCSSLGQNVLWTLDIACWMWFECSILLGQNVLWTLNIACWTWFECSTSLGQSLMNNT